MVNLRAMIDNDTYVVKANYVRWSTPYGERRSSPRTKYWLDMVGYKKYYVGIYKYKRRQAKFTKSLGVFRGDICRGDDGAEYWVVGAFRRLSNGFDVLVDTHKEMNIRKVVSDLTVVGRNPTRMDWHYNG